MCRIRSLNSKSENENSRVGKCIRKGKFTARTERKIIHIAKANGRATCHELKISLHMVAYGVNVYDSPICRKLIAAELIAFCPSKNSKVTTTMAKMRFV